MIDVRNLSFSFSETGGQPYALKNVSLTIREGETIAVMGKNGSGKSTFGRCLNGLLQPTAGEVLVDGFSTRDASRLIEIRRRVGMVFQNPDNQIVSATVEREIAFGLENLGLPYDEMHRRVEEMLEIFDLRAHRNRPPHALSGGEKQRLALAAVTAMKPSYLVLDEPTSLLDPKSRKEVLRFVHALHAKAAGHAVTTILITQFPEEALTAERLIIFHDGRIVQDGKPEEIFAEIDLHPYGLEPPVKFRVLELLRKYRIDIDNNFK